MPRTPSPWTTAASAACVSAIAIRVQIRRGLEGLEHAAHAFLGGGDDDGDFHVVGVEAEMPKPLTISSTTGISKAIRIAEGSRMILFDLFF